ncbi:MAG TPA: class I SAM-dependent methyltransferase [Solirubrobacterales bacterium]|jgi:O-methyltransferase involved in polyketide biosynthesis|nr:class I SAM-dependent methyltransferase [Solirubrobacterales bacterium]
MAGSEKSSAAISPTAHYTGETWVRNGLSHPELATWQGRLFHGTLALPNAASRLLGGPSLEGMLLARHRIIDAILDDQIQGGVNQVLEVACGMSPRGWRFSQRYGDELTYVEADLPGMARRKREALAQMGSLGDRHRVVDLDVLRDGGPNSLEAVVDSMDPAGGLAIVTEGLLVYLDDETTEALWARLARALGPFPTGVYLSDFRFARQQGGVAERAFETLLGAFVRGSIHPYRGDEADAEAALRTAGFKRASLYRCDEHPAAAEVGREAGAGMLSIIEAQT